MDTDVVDEDSIDTEALQAQIDLSMSFAQNLVTSWMEPRRLPTSSRKRDLEKELSEYMKRPPRLGVGASIPEGHQSMSREAVRLKGKLTGSRKRFREGENETSASARRTSDDDEDESRAAAIKKKQKPDPFDIPLGKKKKKYQDDATKQVSLIEGTQSPSKKQKRSQQESLARNNDFSPLHVPGLEEVSSTLKQDEHSSKPAVTSPSRQLSTSDGKTNHTSIPNTTVYNRIHAELLKRPLLNLTGPPANDDDDDDESDAAEAGASGSLASPKKKKKRRKKKKNHPPIESPCHTSTVVPSTGLRDLQF